jgi:DNA-binding MltR family transcriptional regulator
LRSNSLLSKDRSGLRKNVGLLRINGKVEMKGWKPINIEELSSDTKRIFDVLNNESDLACVLIGTSYLSELLANIIEVSFIKPSISGKLLNPQGGAIGQFAIRADLAYCLGLIKKNVYQDLGIVAEIRNKFAHKHLALDFSDNIIKHKCEKLKTWRILQDENEEPAELSREQMRVQARNQFNLSVVLIGQRIHVDVLSKKKQKKTQ